MHDNAIKQPAGSGTYGKPLDHTDNHSEQDAS